MENQQVLTMVVVNIFCHAQPAPDKNFAIVIIMNATWTKQVEGCMAWKQNFERLN